MAKTTITQTDTPSESPAHQASAAKQPPDADLTYPVLLTLKETANYLRVSRATVLRLLTQRKLPGFQIGGRGQWRVPYARLMEFIHSGD